MKIVTEISATFTMKSVRKRHTHYSNQKSAAATKLDSSQLKSFFPKKSIKHNHLGGTITFFFSIELSETMN